jgi:uncharacterized protein (DUF3820 family)
MKRPFGRYQDMELAEVPVWYLRWLRRQEWVSGWLVQAIDQVLTKAEPSEEMVDEIVKQWEENEEKG